MVAVLGHDVPVSKVYKIRVILVQGRRNVDMHTGDSTSNRSTPRGDIHVHMSTDS